MDDDSDCPDFGNSDDCLYFDCPQRDDCCESCEDSYRQRQEEEARP